MDVASCHPIGGLHFPAKKPSSNRRAPFSRHRLTGGFTPPPNRTIVQQKGPPFPSPTQSHRPIGGSPPFPSLSIGRRCPYHSVRCTWKPLSYQNRECVITELRDTQLLE
ncbi:hypothetical protein TNCT_438491 [Trichonephila clavata]|uniref:Uncharacterized protein n=1 Tax=Trichonephila clavata TaxID=2740835 RepID=A0A8X6HWU6_TRICU|nr:hypothetical protein TNCT_438491 [Trichonephila clavata]